MPRKQGIGFREDNENLRIGGENVILKIIEIVFRVHKLSKECYLSFTQQY